ncbi:ABC transporter substrate-binding protein [Cohnella hashimotonis]|uniref:Extracellular solute-binding protein n=1 Tax=Cohnella hashimotonis TaxID=2826895 RepID=A0ABT6TR84_9BACL|nr:extracellular solute-binding protein [Cohnella hashimotonis]MDI4648444.1 extracellular solute-binding protein [Cohnella hashimotonis]
MNKKWWSGAGVAVMAAGLLAGCGGNDENGGNTSPASASPSGSASASSSEPSASASPSEQAKDVKLTLLNGTVEAVDWLNEQINAFHAQHGNITIEQEFQKSASDVLKVKIASGDTPDIVALAQVPQEFYDQDLFYDFAGDTAVWDRLTNPSIKQSVADTNRADKQFYLPMTVSYTGLYYNKDIVAELGIRQPKTWAEFTAALQSVKDKKNGITPLYLGGKDSWTLGQLAQYLPLGSIQQKLGVEEAHKALVANDAAKLALDQAGGGVETFAKAIMDMKKSGLVNKNGASASYDNQLDAIANGKAAFVIQGMWALGDILKKNPDVKLGFWPIPGLLADDKPYMIGSPDGAISVAEQSPGKEAALQFVAFLMSPDVQKSYSLLRNSPSVYKDASADWSVLSKDIEASTQTAFVASRWPWTPSGYNSDAIGRSVQELLVDAYKTPADFAKMFKDNWDKGYGAPAQ